MSQSSNQQSIFPEFLWAPEVHEALGEQLTFFFVRTAYSKLALQEFKVILKATGLPCFSYLLFGQFDFLTRVWGPQETLKELEGQLKDFSMRFLGDCISVDVRGICYAWAPEKPTSDNVRKFCENLRRLKPEDRRKLVISDLETLKKTRLIIEPLTNRQTHAMKAFTVIRNFNISKQSYSLMERIMTEHVNSFCNRKTRDATLYSTRGDIHFIIRWGASDFDDIVKSTSTLTNTLEHEGFAALFETYFRASNIDEEQENPLVLREGLGAQGPVRPGDERWAEVVPHFSEASEARKELFLHLVKAREFELLPDQVEADRVLRNVLGSYFQESIQGFSAFLQQFFSQFETRLRNRILSKYWPSEEHRQAAVLNEWQKLLGKQSQIPTGSDSGKTVPRLSLGDLLSLAKQLRSDIFDGSANRQLEELVRVRNRLSHGTASIDFDLFVPFLAQAATCSKVLKALEIQPKLPEK